MDSGGPGRRVLDLGKKRGAEKVRTGEAIPDTVATRRHCCPVKGPGQAATEGEVFQKFKWASDRGEQGLLQMALGT